jgi:cytochrome d ubiquinol oxidase subunit II
MTEFFILLVLFVALVAYCVAGGADFGVGIVEMLSPKAERKRVRELSEHAIGPIWEANHVWIVPIIVILFVAFPKVHTQLTTSMYMPLLAMLVGIVLRGTAFTFRYYDLGEDVHSERLWTLLFRTGSLLVPISFGTIAASLHNRTIPSTSTTVWASYIAPWFTLFSLATGLFVASLFAWIASVFLCTELEAEDDLQRWIRRTRVFGIACAVLGALASVTAVLGGALEISQLLAPIPALSLIVATLAAGFVFRNAGRKIWPTRIAVSLATASVLGGYWIAHYPVAIAFDDRVLTWGAAAAPHASLNALSLALIIGLLLIGPGLVVLYRVFK